MALGYLVSGGGTYMLVYLRNTTKVVLPNAGEYNKTLGLGQGLPFLSFPLPFLFLSFSFPCYLSLLSLSVT